MKLIIKRILIGLVALIAIFAIYLAISWPKWVEAGFPQINGEITLAGLDGPVDVYRDESGIPHIYASTTHDLFFAQGYVTAQDRFWQMDFSRHMSAGRVSELVGSSALGSDKFLRTLGWERVAKEELKLLDDETMAMLEAYSEGVNAYLAEHEGAELGFEYVFINVLNSGYEPALWEPLNSVTWPKAMAWQLAGNMDDEITRAIMLASLTPEQIQDLYPPYPDDRPFIVNDQSGFTKLDTPAAGLSPELMSHVSPALEQAAEQFDLLYSFFGAGPDQGLGSNSWVVSGDLTDTGMPLFANDPHLPATLPHVWYVNGLHCFPKTDDCSIDMVGFSLPGVPAIIIGHTDKIAWGMTNVGADVMDLYIEKINPDNPYQYEVNGEWVDMEVITEEIGIGTKKTEEIEVRITRHGPLITDVYGLDNFHEESGLDLPENYAIALRWTALEPNEMFKWIIGLAYAENFEDFREAGSYFAVPAQNLLYADVNGNIGYQMPGWVPIRAGDSDGRYPVPGWTDDHEWLGYIPFDELPYAYNPAEGYIVTANNAVVDDTYPYQIADYWAYGNRAQRIVDMIEEAPGPIDVAYFQKMQGDNKDLIDEGVAPFLLAVSFEDENMQEYLDLLDGWDYQNHMDSPEAALFNVFWNHLLLETFDELPEDMTPGGGSSWYGMLRPILDDPTNEWWDILETEEVETRDAIFRTAFADAVKELKDKQGNDPEKWHMGGLHTFSLPHDVMSNFPFINKAFERGPYEVSGGSGIVNAGEFVSMRMIVDMSNLANSFIILPTGQSGHPGHPHYIDMVDLWRFIEYVPMFWDLDGLRGNTEGHLQLVP